MINAMPLEKNLQFNNITNWTNFKKKFISEFGSIPILECKAHAVFNLLPVYKSVQELAEDLSPKIKNLESIINCVQEYHPIGTLHNSVLTPNLNSNIIRTLPMELRISFNKKYTAFFNLDPDNNICSPAVFKFLNLYVEDLNNSYKANPMLFDTGLSPMYVGVKPVRYEFPKNHNKSSSVQARTTVRNFADLVSSVPSRGLTQITFPFLGNVESRDLAP